MASPKKTVAVVKCNDPGEGVLRALALLEAEGDFKPSSDVVFIKPNIVATVPSENSPEVTEQRTVAALVRYFYERGAQKVVVGEGPAWGALSRDAYRVSGMEKAVLENGGFLCDMDEEPEVAVPVDGYVLKEIRLPRALAEADMVVNVPKAKTHFLTGVTLGLKNVLGAIRYEYRKKYHREFDQAFFIADLQKAYKPDVTVIDAVMAMEGFGPHGGTPLELGVVLAGTDTMAVDTVGCHLMCINPRSLALMQAAEKLGIGTTDMSLIKVVGEDIEKVKQPFSPPLFQYVSKYDNVSVYAGGVCPGCKPRIPSVPLGWDPSKKYAVIIGREPIAVRPDVEADEFWLVGNCGVKAGMAYLLRRAFQGGFKSGMPRIAKVPGCPPLDWYSQKSVFPPLREKGWMTN
ncbi:MAG: DUF362 domain-containing protein [Peptococcaceae bacterium]|jgi:uncharacterized protein (DUF362 family)|nr:DUF362 domain-containing protein [Peptococcaceae bacterium]MDH7524837.1 DUF362 domain-containing protein [Peptococcaceae bacterium]